MLKVENLHAFYGKSHVLHGVHFDVNPGEIVALLGRNGSGRSTTAKAIMGMVDCTGSVQWKGQQSLGKKPYEIAHLGIGYVPEDRKEHGLVLDMSIADNVTLPILGRFARLGWLNPRQERQAAASGAQRLEVKMAAVDQRAGELSGGNQQKVMIGRALMPGPRVLLLDEPSRGVDIGARGDILDRLRVLADQGIVVLFATSDIDEALLAADRIVVLAGGRVTADLDGAHATESALVRAANDVRAHAA